MIPPPPPEWYHEIELPSGRTPGLFDLDPVREVVPWPDLTGARCLDLATFDGYWAFEMERRGAAEVVALDVPRSRNFDWLPRGRSEAHDIVTGDGFRHAAAMLGSGVERIEGNIYELSPEDIGTFDVVLLGALLLHLSSPFAALERVRQVCAGTFVSIEQVDAWSSLLSPRRGVLVIADEQYPWVWSVPNRAGHRALLHKAGFDVREQVPSILAFGDRVPPGRQQRVANRVRDRVARRVARVPDVPGLWASVVTAEPNRAVAAGDHLPIAHRRLA